jgi:hypothetical protein
MHMYLLFLLWTWFCGFVKLIRQHDSNTASFRLSCSMVKGRAANTWLALTDCIMSGNVDKQTQRHAKENISTLVNLFYKSLDAEKSGKEVSMFGFLFYSPWL